MKVSKLKSAAMYATLAALLVTSPNVFAYPNVQVGNNSVIGDATSRPLDGKAHGDAVVIGSDVNNFGESSITIGVSWDATSDDAHSPNVTRTVTNGNHSTNIGAQSVVLGEDNTAIGSQTVIGYNSFNDWRNSGDKYDGAKTGNFNITRAVALGANSVAKESDTVSIGNDTLKRKIVNLADGVDSNDAVNVKQLNTVKNDLTTALNAGLDTKANKDASNISSSDAQKWADKLGTGKVATGDKALVNGDTVNTAISNATKTLGNQVDTKLNTKANTGLDNINDAGKTVIRNLSKEAVKLENGNNTTVTSRQDGNSTIYKVNVSNTDIIKAVDPKLTELSNTVDTKLATKANKDASNISTSDAQKWADKLGTGKVATGDKALVNGDTVNTAISNATKTLGNQVDTKLNTKSNRDASNLTNSDKQAWADALGTGTVTAGNTALVNGGTVYNSINQLEHQLGNRIAQVGATSAALAALHPLEYDPNGKLEFSVGYGNYDSKNAVALGTFYRPNENVMFSLGATLNSDKKAYNAGLTFRIGSGSNKQKMVAADNERIKELENKVYALSSMVSQLSQKQTRPVLSNERLGFNDVPANHWAAEAVETLHANDIIHGYPDGGFHGNEDMSRYEYAQMLYNELKQER